MRYSEIIVEGRDKDTALSAVIAASIKARSKLSLDARSAVDQWQAVNWDSGALELAYRKNNALAAEITQAFEPVARVLHSQYGDSITLYRGQRNFEVHELTNNRVLFSWTADPKVAGSFARSAILYPEISDDEIAAALDKFQSRGFVEFADRTYMRSVDDPRYYIIYRNHAYSTDGLVSELASDLADIAQDRKASNDRALARGQVVSAAVPISLIVWVANDLDSKEFIVKLNPLKLNT